LGIQRRKTSDGRTPWALLGEDLQKIGGPKQIWAATLWEEVVSQEEVLEDLNGIHTPSKELAEVLRFGGYCPNEARKPVLDVLGNHQEVG
jgi:hypothetical protein